MPVSVSLFLKVKTMFSQTGAAHLRISTAALNNIKYVFLIKAFSTLLIRYICAVGLISLAASAKYGIHE